MFGKFGNLFGDMQEKQEALKIKLKGMELVSESSDGKIKVSVNGVRMVTNISIDPSILNAENQEEIEDLLLATINQALEKAIELETNETQKLIKDMLPPGLGNLGGLFGK